MCDQNMKWVVEAISIMWFDLTCLFPHFRPKELTAVTWHVATVIWHFLRLDILISMYLSA